MRKSVAREREREIVREEEKVIERGKVRDGEYVKEKE